MRPDNRLPARKHPRSSVNYRNIIHTFRGCFTYLFIYLFVCLFILPVQVVKLTVQLQLAESILSQRLVQHDAAELDRFRERISPHMGIRMQ